MTELATNVHYYGDNLDILRRYLPDANVDEEPSKPMLVEAASAGIYTSPLSGTDHPRIQILTIRELLEERKKPMLPLLLMPTYQQAERIPNKQAAEQKELFGI